MQQLYHFILRCSVCLFLDMSYHLVRKPCITVSTHILRLLGVRTLSKISGGIRMSVFIILMVDFILPVQDLVLLTSLGNLRR